MGIVHLDEKDFEAEVIKSDVPVIVDFYADWCGPCQMLGPVLEDVSKKYIDKVKFVKIDVDKAQGLAQKYSVSSIPTLVLIKDGKELERHLGYKTPDQVTDLADKLL